MAPNLDHALSFLARHGRLLDRLRLQHLVGTSEAEHLVAALHAYRNPDGGFGWGLEPDLRSVSSQPVGAMHALEVLAEVAPSKWAHTLQLFDWLRHHTLDDGGLPFALPVLDPDGCSPVWLQSDPAISSFQMTAQVAANAHRLARHQPEITRHPWLAAATSYCIEAITELDARPHAYELLFALRFVDAASHTVPEASTLLDRLRRYVPDDGTVAVAGGSEGERLHLLDLAPDPGGLARTLFASEVVGADLERLGNQQQPDGGWPVGFDTASPAAALEWRGYATVNAVSILRRNQP